MTVGGLRMKAHGIAGCHSSSNIAVVVSSCRRAFCLSYICRDYHYGTIVGGLRESSRFNPEEQTFHQRFRMPRKEGVPCWRVGEGNVHSRSYGA